MIEGTLQLPFPSAEVWQQRLSRETESTLVSLVACDGDEVVGTLGLHLNGGMPRRQHVAELGMAVRDDWQGRSVAPHWDAGRRRSRGPLDAAAPASVDRVCRQRTGNPDTNGSGFEVEGTLRELVYRDSRYVDGLMMARAAFAQA